MSTINSYTNEITGDLVVMIRIGRKEVMDLNYTDSETEYLRAVSDKDITGIETLEALILLLKKIEERNK